MKKIFLLPIMLLGLSFAVSAQDIADNALGLRLGGSDGFSAEVSYQRALTNNNRLELDLGWRNSSDFNAIKLVGLYEWVWLLDGNFNWYAGAGGGLASFSGNNNSNIDDQTSFFIAGTIGIEYNFDIPLQLSLDFRPEIGSNNFTNNSVFDIALGIRYRW